MIAANGNPIATHAIKYVMSIDNAVFWIDYRKYTAERMVSLLFTGALKVRGFEFDDTARLDPRTGDIVVVWNEIVVDGKGGHKETRRKVLKLQEARND